MYEQRQGVKPNNKKAVELLKQSKTTTMILQAEQGDTDAQKQLGEMYHTGDSVPYKSDSLV